MPEDGFESFLTRLAAVRARVAAACAAAGRRPEEVRILPVTKTHPAAAAIWAARAGFGAVAENRVQEATAKRPEAARAPAAAGLRWELIGHLQSNKARAAAEVFDVVQSVDSVRLARLLGRAAAETGRALAVLVQVNSGRDPAKFGCEPEAAGSVVEAVLAEGSLRLQGLMAIAPLGDDPDLAVRTFEGLREIRDRLVAATGRPLPELSMGMSGDLEAAVRAGSTVVRVGTALFGPRPVPA